MFDSIRINSLIRHLFNKYLLYDNLCCKHLNIINFIFRYMLKSIFECGGGVDIGIGDGIGISFA